MSITIVGGGISGLSLAYFLLEQVPNIEIRVLEAEGRPGGKIWTDRADGFLCEWGVNGFLDSKPRTLELASKLSINPLRSNDAARKRFIYTGGRLRQIPETPPAFLKSDLLSFKGKLRIIYELFAPKGTGEDETLANFARRRLGKEAYEKMIDPMASGIYAGDPEKLSLRSCFPRIYQLEREYGSLIRAMIKLQKEAKKSGRSVGPGPGGTLTSFYDGMETMVRALRDSLGDRLVTDWRVVEVQKYGDGYVIYNDHGETIETENLVLACPAHEASKITQTFDEELSGLLSQIPYPAVSVVCLGFKRESIRQNLDAFGFLVPFREKKKILGTLYDSSIFPNRAPDGYVLLRTMVGGARASELALQEEERLVNLVLEELFDLMGLRAEPVLSRVYKHEKAIPQYNLGHQELLGRIEDARLRHPNFYLTGNAYRGIGVNDCIENSFNLAGVLVSNLKQPINN
ncbi:MAG: protoporphyrinogen oxidase [Nitrospirae bacterium]|nr:MAG: protoporphyrinogen oxidase [Nitrospirota bacterium]